MARNGGTVAGVGGSRHDRQERRDGRDRTAAMVSEVIHFIARYIIDCSFVTLLMKSRTRNRDRDRTCDSFDRGIGRNMRVSNYAKFAHTHINTHTHTYTHVTHRARRSTALTDRVGICSASILFLRR